MHQVVTRGSSNTTPNIGAAQNISRILREYREIQKDPSPYWCAYPICMDEPYEWHFTIKGPTSSDFEGGMYHGRIILPQSYPFSPPSIMLLTQNGRFEIGKKICLSASNYHPELWQPAWGIRTMLDALHAFFPTPGEGAVHSLDWSSEIRTKLAKDSAKWYCNTCKETNKEISERLCTVDTNISSSLSNPLIDHFMNSIKNVNVTEDETINFTRDTKSLSEENDLECSANNQIEKKSEEEILRDNHPPKSNIPTHRLPPSTSQNFISWNSILLRKPSNIHEFLLFIMDLLVFILFVSIIVCLIKFILQSTISLL
ncbi:ubiquitin-conjugating enzyme family protein [Cryptosporidium andersoni]|uniref:Ubiquitin-conjugating enzyme family protein n=1 Tax=Cryptosporidium andersoni TaxID=117008 RepID=A0A1J4MLE0_9CRYT|nr:ubiquitin-conjugating enzyme family protein [Cryptosporidium andersoni]